MSRAWLSLVAAALGVPCALLAQERYAPLIDGVLAAWDRADVVCLGEDHGHERDSNFRIALVRDPRLPRSIDVIVVEFANPVHQGVLDRFTLQGDEMSRDELGIVWRDATSPSWESPIYEAFLRAVRDVNLGLPPAERLRVLAGDSPTDWSAIQTVDDLIPTMNRGKNIRDFVAREVLHRHLKALAIFGAGHCVNVGMGFPGELERRYPGRFWAVYGFYGADGTARARTQFGLTDEPAYLVVRGTERAALPATGLFITDSRADRTVGDMLDAILWFGAEPDRVVPAPGDWPDAEARRELERRSRLSRAAAERLYGGR